MSSSTTSGGAPTSATTSATTSGGQQNPVRATIVRPGVPAAGVTRPGVAPMPMRPGTPGGVQVGVRPGVPAAAVHSGGAALHSGTVTGATGSTGATGAAAATISATSATMSADSATSGATGATAAAAAVTSGGTATATGATGATASPAVSPQASAVPMPIDQVATLIGAPLNALLYAVATGALVEINGEITPSAALTWEAGRRRLPPMPTPRAAFIEKFTPAEQQAFVGNAASLIWWLKLMDRPTIDLHALQTVADVQGLVIDGTLTQARAVTVLSP